MIEHLSPFLCASLSFGEKKGRWMGRSCDGIPLMMYTQARNTITLIYLAKEIRPVEPSLILVYKRSADSHRPFPSITMSQHLPLFLSTFLIVTVYSYHRKYSLLDIHRVMINIKSIVNSNALLPLEASEEEEMRQRAIWYSRMRNSKMDETCPLALDASRFVPKRLFLPFNFPCYTIRAKEGKDSTER